MVDDHEVVLAGIRGVIDRRTDVMWVGEASDVPTAVTGCRQLEPDIVLMDMFLGDRTGVEACREIRESAPGMAVAFLTSSDEPTQVMAAVLAGARGYILKQSGAPGLGRALDLKQSGAPGLGRALDALVAGRSLLDPAVTTPLLERIRRTKGTGSWDTRLSPLRASHLRVLDGLVVGRSNAEIAAELQISPYTVKNTVSEMLALLGLDRRAQIPAWMDAVQRPIPGT